jgi:hypothetical protein
MLEAGRSQVRFPVKSLDLFSVYLIHPAALYPWDLLSLLTETSAKKIFLVVKRDLSVRLATSPPFVSLLSRKCEIIDVSQPYRPPRPATGIAFLDLVV